MNGSSFSPPPSGAPAPVWELSGWWRRVGAQIIDSLIVGVPAFLIGGVIAFATVRDFEDLDSSDFDRMQLYGAAISIVAASIYYCWMMSATNGQTVGKKVTDIRVVREDGAPVTAGFAFQRQILVMQLLFGWLAAILLYIPTLLNYLWPLWDKGNQALHDKIVKSRVVIATSVGIAEPAPPVQTEFAPQTPFPQAPPATPTPPVPPAPPGGAVPYTPPPGFENPVSDDEK